MPEQARGHSGQWETQRGSGPLGRYGLAEVYNPSMEPTLRPGDRLVVEHGAQVRVGDVVVLRHPLQQDLLIVKRVVERRPGGWWVQGDNPNVRNDSREFGAVPAELVVARARLRLRPPGVRTAGARPTSAQGAGAVGPGRWAVWALGAVRPLSRRFRAR